MRVPVHRVLHDRVGQRMRPHRRRVPVSRRLTHPACCPSCRSRRYPAAPWAWASMRSASRSTTWSSPTSARSSPTPVPLPGRTPRPPPCSATGPPPCSPSRPPPAPNGPRLHRFDPAQLELFPTRPRDWGRLNPQDTSALGPKANLLLRDLSDYLRAGSEHPVQGHEGQIRQRERVFCVVGFRPGFFDAETVAIGQERAWWMTLQEEQGQSSRLDLARLRVCARERVRVA